MKWMLAALLAALISLLCGGAQAQTSEHSVMGYEKTGGCPGGISPCFVPYGATLPVTSGSGTVSGTGAAPSGPTTIAAANTYQVLFGASTITHGCYVSNPSTNTATLWVDFAGTTGTTLAGTGLPLVPGQTTVCSLAYTNQITVYSSSTISFAAGVN